MKLKSFVSLLLSFIFLLIISASHNPAKAAPATGYTASFGPLGNPAESWDTAQEFINILNSNQIGHHVTGFYTYEEGSPVGVSGNTKILPGKGYLIDFYYNPSTKFYNYFSDYAPINSLTYYLPLSSPGYFGLDFGNLISIPEGVMSELKNMKAEDFCVYANNQGASVYQIATATKDVFVKTNLFNENLTFHVCEDKANNFSLSSGVGYFVYVTSSSYLTLP